MPPSNTLAHCLLLRRALTAATASHRSRPESQDTHVLRRKGRLKEQDALIDWIIRLHATDGPETVFAKVERWVDEHRARPHGSTLSMHVPVLGSFLTPLPLADALAEYDQFSGLSRRRYVPPNFAEVRHVLNIAQVHALAKLTRGEGESLPLLVTFDADGTLYEDGKHFEADNKMISLLVSLMRRGVQVAIVTAAGYPEAERFEARIRALLAAFEELQLPKETTDRFHMMGGECNYLLAVTDDYRLEFVPNERWQTEEMIGWDESAVEALLDTAQASLESHAARLSMDVDLIRKSRAVGVVPVRPTLYEALEELALSTRYDLESAELDLPFCAFNGGNDVFCDGAMRSPQRGAAVVAWAGRLALTRRLRRARPNAPSPPAPARAGAVGNKAIGLQALQAYLGVVGGHTLHVGDRFTLTGNDTQVRGFCSILWVANPDETAFFIKTLLRDLKDIAGGSDSGGSGAEGAKALDA